MMKTKWTIFLVLICAILIILIRNIFYDFYKPSVVGADQFKAYQSSVKVVDYDASYGHLRLEAIAAPYADNVYYIPLESTTDLSAVQRMLSWSVPGYEVFLLADPLFLIKNQWVCFTQEIIFTSLPVVSLVSTPGLLPIRADDITVGVSTALPGGNGHSCLGSYHVRGQTSSNFEKTGYRLRLYDRAYNAFSLSLLGEYASESKLLLPMYTDPTWMREKIAQTLWWQLTDERHDFDASGSVLEYVELILNGSYHGLYGLVVPMDEGCIRQDNSSNLALYKIKSWFSGKTMPDSAVFSRMIETIYTQNSAVDWMHMLDYLDAVYIESDADRLLSYLNLDNSIDYYIFLNVIAGLDNTFKNTYYVWRGKDEGSAQFYKLPWDLDITFGSSYTREGGPDRRKYNENWESLQISVQDMDLLRREIPGINDKIIQRYFDLRKTSLSDSSIVSMVSQIEEQLTASGALLRERERWPKKDALSEDEQNFSVSILERVLFLDENIASLES